MTVKVTVSDMMECKYCEHSLWIRLQTHSTGKPTKQNENRLLGQKRHEYLDEKFLSQTKRKIAFSEFVRTLKRMKTRVTPTKVILAYDFGDYTLAGRPDEIISDITGIYVIDDKYGY